jgi:hypothetical protein
VRNVPMIQNFFAIVQRAIGSEIASGARGSAKHCRGIVEM